MIQPLDSLTASLRSFRPHLLLIGLCLAIQAAYGALIPLSLRTLIDRAIIPRNWNLLVGLIFALAAASVLAAGAAVLRDYLHAVVGAGVIGDLRSRMFRHLQSLSMEFHSRFQVGDVLARFSTDLVATESLLLSTLPAGLGALTALVLGLVLLFVLEWRLACLSVLALPLCLLGPRLLTASALAANARAKQAVVAATSFVQEHLGAQAVVKAFGLQGGAHEGYARRLEAVRVTTIRAYLLGTLVERTPILWIWVLQLLILGTGGALALRGSLSIGTLVSFQALFLTVSGAVTGITEVIPAVLRAAGGLQRIHDLLEETPHVRDSPDAVALTRMCREIEFRGVTFGYLRDHPVLRDVSFTIHVGEHIAIVGPNGAGKSALVNLLLRFYDPGAGSILWDGHDLRGAAQASLREQMGIVLQEGFLFDATIRENIRLGRLSASDDDVEAAARAAGAHSFITRLPEGYATVVGDRGSRLSAGQRQRIAIARALVRRPAVLVLDEATAGVDAATEAAIMATLADAARGLALVTVTHRLANVTDADGILVMDGGRLVEQGTHAELLRRDGAYARLWQKQNAFTVDEAHARAHVDVSWLKEIPILAALDEGRLAEIADRFIPEGYLEDRIVIHQGDPGDTFYIIARGTVEVVRRDDAGVEERVATLEDGDGFGEIALLQDVPRTATVRTVTPCVLLSLRRAHFLALMHEDPGVGEAVDQMRLRSQAASDPAGAEPRA
jgi:ATP-binding cassette subfamily B protein